MFTRAIAAFYFILSLAILAAAMPGGAPPTKTTTVTQPAKTTTVTVTAPGSSPTGSDTCSTGPIQCCNQVGQVGLLNVSSQSPTSVLIIVFHRPMTPFSVCFWGCSASSSTVSIFSLASTAPLSPSSALAVVTRALPTWCAAKTTTS